MVNGQIEFHNKSITLTKNDQEIDIDILDILGASNAIVYNIQLFKNGILSTDKYCLKLSPSGTIQLDDEKIAFINKHSNYFVKVFYFQANIVLDKPFVLFGKQWSKFDLLIMEKTDTTLEVLCNNLQHYQYLSESVLQLLLSKLLILSFLMYEKGYYYMDIKPANIGIVVNGNKSTFKLIDVDSLMTIHDSVLYTYSTSGLITKKTRDPSHFFVAQLLTVFFTIFATLFNDQYSIMCNSNSFLFYSKDMLLIKFLQSIQNNLSLKCSQYKYIILTASTYFGLAYIKTYTSVQKFLHDNNIIKSANDFVSKLTRFLQTYFDILPKFVAKIIYSLFVLILLTDEQPYNKNTQYQLLYQLFNFLFNLTDVINDDYFNPKRSIEKMDDTYRQSISPGFIIVDSLYRYISDTCKNDCKNIVNVARKIAY